MARRSLSDYLAEVHRGIPSPNVTPPLQQDMTAPIAEDLSNFRMLSAEESALLTWLLEHGVEGSDQFLCQLPFMKAEPSCSCGCPSLALRVIGHVPPILNQPRMIADYLGKVDGKLVGLILWNAGGQLSELEVYDLEGVDRTFGLPAIETLEKAVWEAPQ